MEKSITKNSIFYLIYSVLNVLFPFVSGIYVARVLLPETIGIVAYAQNVVGYFVLFAYLGIPTYGTREISKYRNDRENLEKVFSELYIINFVSTIVFIVLYLCFITIVADFKDNYSVYLVTGFLLALNTLNIDWLYSGLEEFKLISIRNILFKFVSFAFLLIFVKSDKDILFYSAFSVIGTAGNYIFNALYRRNLVSFTFIGLDFKRHVKPILALVFVNIALQIESMIDVTMLGIQSTKESVAYYSYAHKIEQIAFTVVNSITTVLLPRLSFYYKQGQQSKYNSLLSKGVYYSLILSLPMIVGIYFVSDSLITILYGKQFLTSSSLLRFLIILILIRVLGNLLGTSVCVVTGHENKMLVPVSMAAITNVVLNYFMIPLFGAKGAVVASIASETVLSVAYIRNSRLYFKINNNQRSNVAIFSSLLCMALYLEIISVMGGGIYKVLMLQITGAIIVYFSVLYIFKEQFFNEIVYKFVKRLTRS